MFRTSMGVVLSVVAFRRWRTGMRVESIQNSMRKVQVLRARMGGRRPEVLMDDMVGGGCVGLVSGGLEFLEEMAIGREVGWVDDARDANLQYIYFSIAQGAFQPRYHGGRRRAEMIDTATMFPRNAALRVLWRRFVIYILYSSYKYYVRTSIQD